MLDLLEALYSNGPAVAGVDPFRWRVERKRRINDLSAQLHRYAPLTMALGRDFLGEEFVLRVAGGLSSEVSRSSNIYLAAIQSLHKLIEILEEPILEIPLAHEAAKAGDFRALREPSAAEGSVLEQAALFGVQLLDRPWRFGVFLAEAQLALSATHMPSMPRALVRGRQVYAYTRSAPRRIADVTDALIGLSSVD